MRRAHARGLAGDVEHGLGERSLAGAVLSYKHHVAHMFGSRSCHVDHQLSSCAVASRPVREARFRSSLRTGKTTIRRPTRARRPTEFSLTQLLQGVDHGNDDVEMTPSRPLTGGFSPLVDTRGGVVQSCAASPATYARSLRATAMSTAATSTAQPTGKRMLAHSTAEGA